MTTATTPSVQVELGNPQEKKHSTRFDALSDDAALSSAYVTKAALNELGNPGKIRITIEAA